MVEEKGEEKETLEGDCIECKFYEGNETKNCSEERKPSRGRRRRSTSRGRRRRRTNPRRGRLSMRKT